MKFRRFFLIVFLISLISPTDFTSNEFIVFIMIFFASAIWASDKIEPLLMISGP